MKLHIVCWVTALFNNRMIQQIISFDHDDTLWECLPVINNANKILDEYMITHYKPLYNWLKSNNVAIWDVMNDIEIETTTPVNKNTIRVTELRKLAVERCAINAEMQYPKEVADDCFRVWIVARNNVRDFLHEGLLDMLKRLKNRNIVMGTITNGNSHVKRIQELQEFMSFCVSAEDAGSCKTTGVPFRIALETMKLIPVGASLDETLFQHIITA
eukprot:GHVL01016919.1.p1 GENE.GHVL01016919.1~~GHVL01016919.1.p1  ORF type:complete len:215 (+),score=29.80 GHVL01016919.1:116-760(+)